MPPENPARYKLDDDDRLQIPRGALPSWLAPPTAEVEVFCVPIRWYRSTELPSGRELEAWCLWSALAPGDWVISPNKVVKEAERNSTYFALRTLMYPAKYSTKGRLSCAGLFDALVKASNGEKEFWVAPELDTISVWTNASFHVSYGRLAP